MRRDRGVERRGRHQGTGGKMTVRSGRKKKKKEEKEKTKENATE